MRSVQRALTENEQNRYMITTVLDSAPPAIVLHIIGQPDYPLVCVAVAGLPRPEAYLPLLVRW